ncbi:alkaline shock response membrane anchor protein AmaP [Paenibacillus taiwanensis]|uniref:alkaline shock response membrane anchor protein AmaP n=1 Tax=Paenibacillus taiwanensis TaxID=401638 RepID=UPI0004249FD1|nr:alkaline shock response membrane anchor protein AmaP [Paenibacillus taiwanensis]
MGRIFDRLLLFLYSIVIGTLSVAAIIVASGLLPELIVLNLPDGMLITVITVAAVLFLISIRFFYVSIRRERTSLPSIDQRTEIGDIKISLETIENVALKAAGRVRGVKDLKARIRANDAGLDIMIRAIVDGENAIPGITEEVQRNVRDYVHEITGIPVSYVSVYVANVVQSQTFKARVE